MKRLISALIATTALCGICATPTVTIDASSPGQEISPTMYGIFFEDINFGADGGLYAELLKNGSFEFPDSLMGWHRQLQAGSEGYMYTQPHPGDANNAHYLHMQMDAAGNGYGISNEGFRSIGVRQGADYHFSVLARQTAGTPITLRIELVDADGTVLAENKLSEFGTDWQEHKLTLTAQETEPKATLNLWIDSGNGELDLDLVSLFPADTWSGQANMLRADLVQLLADMKPGFLRFPGGCIVEGRTLERRYQWKTTVGDPTERKLLVNRWNTEFGHRITPDYYQSFGLGFYEYFLLSEDLNAEPMPIINCGMACQFNTGELVPVEELDPYIQDALDLIEFANGPIDSTWGGLRADMGHPEPFNMKMLGIGNEQWGPQYIERYLPMVKAIKAKYPDMQIIAATGSDASIFPNGEDEIDYLWSQWRKLLPEFVDEHFYRVPEWFIENTHWYDDYDRNGPKLFVGEYASQSVGVASPDNRNILKCALYEAAFMTGMERNADVVRMTCYAPLFGHEDAWQWRPDMIWFDNLNAYGSVNYYVQQLFSLYPGTHMLNCKTSGVPMLNDTSALLNVSSTLDKKAGEIIIKAVNIGDKPLPTTFDIQAAETGNKITIITLSSDSLDDENTIEDPEKVTPNTSSVEIIGPVFTYELAPYSFTILRVPVQ